MTDHFVARLLDTEGVTVKELAVAPSFFGRPPQIIRTAATPLIKMQFDPEPQPMAVTFKYIEYKLERVDGGGTLIYRRITDPWGD